MKPNFKLSAAAAGNGVARALSGLAAACMFAAPLAAADPANQAKTAAGQQDVVTQRTSATRGAASSDEIKLANRLGATLREENGEVFVVKMLKGGAAHKAGVRPGDEILQIDGHKIASINDVKQALADHKPGQALQFSVSPAKGARHLTLVPAAAQAVPLKAPDRPMIGAVLANESGEVVVMRLYEGGPAEQSGIRSGDDIKAIDGHHVTTREQCVAILNRHKPGDDVNVTLERDGWRRNFLVKLAARKAIAGLPTADVPSEVEQVAPVESANWVDDSQYEDLVNPALRAVDTDFDG